MASVDARGVTRGEDERPSKMPRMLSLGAPPNQSFREARYYLKTALSHARLATRKLQGEDAATPLSLSFGTWRDPYLYGVFKNNCRGRSGDSHGVALTSALPGLSSGPRSTI